MKAVNRFNHEVPTYDDGFDGDPLWVFRETFGAVAVIRAGSWEDAWSVCEDLFMSDADPEDPDTYASSYDNTAPPEQLAEGVGYRPNGTPADPRTYPEDNPLRLVSHLHQEDLNGSYLDRTTAQELQEYYRINLTLDPEE